jgi:hypothetical protein
MRRLAAGGLAGIALSLVRGCVDGRLLRDCSRRELRVGDRGHGHGGGRLEGGIVDCVRGWRTRFRVKPVVLDGAQQRREGRQRAKAALEGAAVNQIINQLII